MDPPLMEFYKALSENSPGEETKTPSLETNAAAFKECELPVIDLSRLTGGESEREECENEIVEASKSWGFFQVVSHGISGEILERMRSEEVKLFRQPFSDKFASFSEGSYRWGTPSATRLNQLSWSEAFHVPLKDIVGGGGDSDGRASFSSAMEQFAAALSGLARTLAKILAEKIGYGSSLFEENWQSSACFLRMNRYPPCPFSSELFGLMPHTDSDFLTIVHQDEVGGLQLLRDGKWLFVKPNPEALIINIGDLFQAWSNNIYKSVEHRVVPNQHFERFSTAYFLCPSFDTVIQSSAKPPVYREFSFEEYRQQVEDDVRKFGCKIGLPRFLV